MSQPKLITLLKIIGLFGGQSAMPALRFLFRRNYLSAVFCPVPAIGIDTEAVGDWAISRGLPCWQVDQTLLEQDLEELINEISPDLILMYGFPYAVPMHLLQRVKYGGWNVQFSFYPTNEADITIHQMAEGKGPSVLRQCHFYLISTEEGGCPINQLSLLSTPMLQDALTDIVGQEEKAVVLPQKANDDFIDFLLL